MSTVGVRADVGGARHDGTMAIELEELLVPDAETWRHDGRAQVRAAQEDGRWQRACAGAADAVVPADLAAAPSADPSPREPSPTA